MVNKLFGIKMGMTRYFLEEGKSSPVTVLQIGPCVVTQKKTTEKEGYNAIQVGYGPRKEKRVNKPLRGHFKASGNACFSYLKEIRVEDPGDTNYLESDLVDRLRFIEENEIINNSFTLTFNITKLCREK